MPWHVEVKLQRHSLIKVSKPMMLNKDALFKYFGIQANTKTRRQVKGSFKKSVVLKEV
ncbi:hypothetical protein [Candidatus Mycoplasma mahonii]|uniref:hypothetical protein n=1 Tax=Candidatus Mycoplasma mahonii TaxID=3004105 RepID=UPI0026ED0D02|nr:hypothetical protein [Candidatus Mycoplasma mahonii]WKX02284.1 hypothetical protein O3I44_02670 [Candidatus Mycoplasma mahonii]